jgi:hypothetical protein
MKKKRIATSPLQGFTTRRKTNYLCRGRLKADSLVRAVEAASKERLESLDDKLRCECGALVGARPLANGKGFEPFPKKHPYYQKRRRPDLKSYGAKR